MLGLPGNSVTGGAYAYCHSTASAPRRAEHGGRHYRDPGGETCLHGTARPEPQGPRMARHVHRDRQEREGGAPPPARRAQGAQCPRSRFLPQGNQSSREPGPAGREPWESAFLLCLFLDRKSLLHPAWESKSEQCCGKRVLERSFVLGRLLDFPKKETRAGPSGPAGAPPEGRPPFWSTPGGRAPGAGGTQGCSQEGERRPGPTPSARPPPCSWPSREGRTLPCGTDTRVPTGAGAIQGVGAGWEGVQGCDLKYICPLSPEREGDRSPPDRDVPLPYPDVNSPLADSRGAGRTPNPGVLLAPAPAGAEGVPSLSGEEGGRRDGPRGTGAPRAGLAWAARSPECRSA